MGYRMQSMSHGDPSIGMGVEARHGQYPDLDQIPKRETGFHLVRTKHGVYPTEIGVKSLLKCPAQNRKC